jgi:hypothetical protein
MIGGESRENGGREALDENRGWEGIGEGRGAHARDPPRKGCAKVIGKVGAGASETLADGRTAWTKP